MSVKHREKKNFLNGIRASLARRRIQKYHRRLGNGHDVELHLTIAALYQHLGEDSLAVESYYLAVRSLSKGGESLELSDSDQLIDIYKQILALTLDDEIANKLGQEYQRRGMEYRAIALHTILAERYVRQEDFHKAIERYQWIYTSEPGNIRARVACAKLHCQLKHYEKGAKEYTQIADMYFEHRKFDGALEHYQQAAKLFPDDETLRKKVCLTQSVLEGTFIPQNHGDWQQLMTGQNPFFPKRPLAEQEQVEQQLRHDLSLLEQRYQSTVREKNQQLQAAEERLDKLSTYVAVFKDNLENVMREKQRLQQQLDAELTQQRTLENKLATLHTLEPQITAGVPRHEKMERLEEEDEITILEQLQNKFARQCSLEYNFSQQFHESLREITRLLHCQEQEIQRLEQLQP